MNVQQIALEVDIWDILKKYIPGEILEYDILNVQFRFDLNFNNGKPHVRLTIPNGKRVTVKKVEVERDRAEKLIEELCTKFNIPFENMCTLSFELESSCIPIFQVGLYPFVNDESELNKVKSRMNVGTVN